MTTSVVLICAFLMLLVIYLEGPTTAARSFRSRRGTLLVPRQRGPRRRQIERHFLLLFAICSVLVSWNWRRRESRGNMFNWAVPAVYCFTLNGWKTDEDAVLFSGKKEREIEADLLALIDYASLPDSTARASWLLLFNEIASIIYFGELLSFFSVFFRCSS